MGCNCGGGGSSLGNYVVKNKDGVVIKTLSAVKETEAQVFAARNPGSTYSKTN